MELNPLIRIKSDLIDNIQVVEDYLTQGNEDEFQMMISYIQRGSCFVVYPVGNGQLGFVPSKFIGHLNNSIEKHLEKNFYGGGETNLKISRILNEKEHENEEFDSKYIEYCFLLGIKPSLKIRKYWTALIDESAIFQNEEIEFQEGRIIEKLHKFRERSSSVTRIAKQNFKVKNNNRLFCEACEFDFEAAYGELGIDFIEGHHMHPLSFRSKEEATNPNDIAMLCANCHRMVHRYRPWIERKEDLKKILKH